MSEEKLSLARRERDSALATAEAMRDDESARLVYLQRALHAQERVVSIRKAIVDAYEACHACGRKVKVPCHDFNGFHESGPWDFSCEDRLRAAK